MKSFKTIFFFNDFLKNLICFAAPNIEAKQLIYELHRSRIFIWINYKMHINFDKLSSITKVWFVDFIHNNLNQLGLNLGMFI